MKCRALSSREVYRNPWIAVREDQVVWEDGKPGMFGVIEIMPGVSVLALDDDGMVHLVREWKHPLGRYSLEVVSGGVEPDESPLEAAQRELAEELGFRASEWLALGTSNAHSTVVRANAHLFLARGLTPGPTAPDATEHLVPVSMSLDQALGAVMDGEITHTGSGLLILKAARALGLG